jgi:hypothetical protein
MLMLRMAFIILLTNTRTRLHSLRFALKHLLAQRKQLLALVAKVNTPLLLIFLGRIGFVSDAIRGSGHNLVRLRAKMNRKNGGGATHARKKR